MTVSDNKQYLIQKYNRTIISKPETAKELSSSPATIDRMRQRGELQSKAIGGRIFFTVDSIAEFLAE